MAASLPVWVFMAVGVVLPPAALVGVLPWARRLHRKGEAPRIAVLLAYALAAVGALVVVSGIILGLGDGTRAVAGDDVDPSQKARALAEGISEVLNCGALAVCLAPGHRWLASALAVARTTWHTPAVTGPNWVQPVLELRSG